MAQKRGRKSKYETNVQPHLEQIREWAKSGATEKEICDALDIATSTFYEYKKQYSELSSALHAGRMNVVLNIKAALYKKAIGFEYEERRGVKKDGCNGDQMVTEIYKRYYPPDTTAAAMLLRNYDNEWRDRDTAANDFKRQELELKKAIAECNNFDLEI